MREIFFKTGKLQRNAKSSTEKQRFITTIKDVIEEEKKKLKSLIRFHSANKIDNYNRGGIKRRKRTPKNL